MTTHSRRALALLAITTLVLAASACTSSPEAGTAAARTGTAGAAGGEAAASTAPEGEVPAPAAPQVMFVANTGGTGVALRARCEDGARLAGQGLRDGAEVTVTLVGTDQCSGWAQVESGGTTTWVHLGYLSPERPAAVAAAPVPVRPSGGGTGGVSAPPAAPVVQPRFEKVLVYREHLIPLAQLTYRAAYHGPMIMTPTGPRPDTAYICPVYSYAAPTVRTVAGVILSDPDPEGCGFARVDTAVIRDALIQ
jgi:hypothetical protein